MPRTSKKTNPKTIDKGASNLAAQFNPGAGLQTSATTTPENAISVAAMQARFSSIQPVQAYQMCIAVRAAISAIANQISRCPLRLFDRKSGDEIISGELFDIFRRPSPGWSQHQFIEELVSWYNIENEIAIYIPLANTGKPLGLLPICPTRLWVLEPAVINETKEIQKWMYLWPSGMSPFSGMGKAQPEVKPAPGINVPGYNGMTMDARQVVFYHGYNPSSHIRGCSPLITGVNELSTNYFAARYNKELFVNGNWPHVLINAPAAKSPKQIKDMEQRFTEQFSLFNGQSHKTLFIAGTETDVKMIGNGASKEGDFLAMQRFYCEMIFMLYRVPAIEAGFADQTRYQTADQERAIFVEQTILPQMNMISEVLQHQFVDPYYTFSGRKSIQRGQGKKMGKMMEKSLDYSLDQRQESDIIVLLDPDQLPIMSEIRRTQWKAVQAMCDTLHVSVNEAAENLGFELPYSKVRDQIYVPSNYTKIADSPEDDPIQEQKVALNSREQIESIQAPLEEEDIETEEKTQARKDMHKKVHSLFRTLRRKYLSAIEENKIPSLRELDEIASSASLMNAAVKKEIRVFCHNMRLIVKANTETTERVSKAKEYLNTKNRGWEKQVVGRIIK